jgi:DNA-binding XRE family transcriptional regulator/mannose-6-phosphate isomerase-like protein (cupin superfamily)
MANVNTSKPTRRTRPSSGRGVETSPLGERLRKERDRLGLSLRELARRLEVSPSLVSQIETGKIQPSVRTLYAIVSELGVSLDELFAPATTVGTVHTQGTSSRGPARVVREVGELEPGSNRVQRANDRRAIELESGVRWERLTAWNDPDVEFLYATYEVGGASSPEGTLVRHNGREFGTVVGGRLGVTVGFEEYVLEPGDSISFESSTPHRLHNDSGEAVHAIWVVLGRYRADQPVADGDLPSR